MLPQSGPEIAPRAKLQQDRSKHISYGGFYAAPPSKYMLTALLTEHAQPELTTILLFEHRKDGHTLIKYGCYHHYALNQQSDCHDLSFYRAAQVRYSYRARSRRETKDRPACGAAPGSGRINSRRIASCLMFMFVLWCVVCYSVFIYLSLLA